MVIVRSFWGGLCPTVDFYGYDLLLFILGIYQDDHLPNPGVTEFLGRLKATDRAFITSTRSDWDQWLNVPSAARAHLFLSDNQGMETIHKETISLHATPAGCEPRVREPNAHTTRRRRSE